MTFLKRFVSIETLKTTAIRFPAAVICSLTLFVFSVLINHDVMSLDGAMNARIIAFLICGFFYFIITRLLAMRCQHIGWLEPVMAVVGAIVLAVCVLMLEGIAVVLFVIPVLSAFLLGLGLAPYLRNGDSLSFWFFNRQVWEGALISFLASILFFVGVMLALWAIDALFGVDIPRKVHGDIWFFAAIVLAPLYALSWIPTRFEFAEEDCRAPVQLSFILNWILAPLVMVYMAILYAYFVKLAIVGELPSGQLSYMVTAFGGVGVLTYLAGWPLRETGGPLLRFVIKAFFPALFIPVIVQAISIYLRVDQYGFTESRYMIVLTSLWFAILVGLYTFKKPHLKYIPGILAVFLLISAVGPVSFVNVAKTSQFNRFEALLLDNNLLVDGRIVKAKDTLSFDVRKEISAKLDFLRDRGHLPAINPWLPADVQVHADVATYNRGGTTRRYSEEHVKAITQAMGFEYMNRYTRKRDQDIDAYERFNLKP